MVIPYLSEPYTIKVITLMVFEAEISISIDYDLIGSRRVELKGEVALTQDN